MTQEISTKNSNLIPAELQEKVFVGGDLSKLNSEERLTFYSRLCESLNLNPMTRPFEYITLQGKMTLYARKDATEQLRKINNISISNMTSKTINDIYIVQVDITDDSGRKDTSTGAVNISNLKGDSLANAFMKAETKAKRRGTLSFCGLGFLDESEIETIEEVKNKIKYNHKVETKNNDEHYIKEINLCTSIEQLKHVFKQAYHASECEKYREKITEAKDKKKKEIEDEIKKTSIEMFGGFDEISGDLTWSYTKWLKNMRKLLIY